MAYYRLYFMNRHSGHIDGVEDFDAASDAEAIERADARLARAPFELWSGAQKVYRREATSQVSAGTLAGARSARWRLGAH